MFNYKRHEPENTLLYQIIKEYYPQFLAKLREEGRVLPDYVHDEFEDYLKCGMLQHGFLRVRCETCHHEKLVAFSCKSRGFCPSCGAKRMIESAALLVDHIIPHQPMRQWVLSVPFPLRFLFASKPAVMSKVLSIVYRAISSYLIKEAGFKRKQAQTGAVTFIQRFGSGLNLNVHFHMLFLDGVYVIDNDPGARFVAITIPSKDDLVKVIQRISLRIGRYLEKAGYIERDAENSYLTQAALAKDEIGEHRAQSIQYRIAMGPQKGRKVFALQTILPRLSVMDEDENVAKLSSFSLHAGVAIKANQRDQLERVCRYIARPAISSERLSVTPQGKIRYELKKPYRDGTTHIIFEPIDFISKLVALVPIPRVNLVRFHGVFAPNNQYRKAIVPGKKEQTAVSTDPKTESEKRIAMNWARRLKRAFDIDIKTCEACDGNVKIIACIEDPAVINRILKHLKLLPSNDQLSLPLKRAPPSA